MRTEFVLARTLLDQNPTFDDEALEEEDVLLAVWGWDWGPRTLDRSEVASAMIRKRHARDFQGEGGRRVGVWSGGGGRADGRKRNG